MKDANSATSMASIGSVCTVIAGQSPKASFYNDAGNGLPFYQGKKEFTDRYLGSPTTWTTSVTKKAEAGDILMSVRAPVGPINEATEVICIGRGLAAIRTGDRVNRDYLWYALLWLQPAIKGNAGAVFESINKAGIEKLEIPLPPLEEQLRIVAVLDEAFEGLARARAHTEANLEDSHEIATRALDVLIADLIERNGRVPINEIAAVKGGKRLPKGVKTSVFKTPFPYITVRDFTEDGTVSTERLGFISEEIQEGIARYTISSQDVYVSIAGTIGKSGIVPDELDGANLTENAAKLVLENGWSNEYVYWCTRSSDFGAQTAEQTRVAAQPKLALQRLGAITVPKADETEQVELCEKMASIRSTRSDLVVAYGQKLQDLDDLRQSLLQKAFAGELT